MPAINIIRCCDRAPTAVLFYFLCMYIFYLASIKNKTCTHFLKIRKYSNEFITQGMCYTYLALIPPGLSWQG